MTTARHTEPIVNAMTVDVEDYFHVSALASAAPRDSWDSFESRVVANTDRLLLVFAEHGVTATFFVLGWVADRHPALVRRIASAGHELASHSYWHRLVYEMTPAEFRDDLRRARRAIEDAAGVAVSGFRAPSFSITQQSLWALDTLIEEGYSYDTSIFPIRHDRYGIPDAPRHVHTLSCAAGSLVELPPATLRVGRLNVPIAGGGYLRFWPYGWTAAGIRRINGRERRPVCVYLHPWEVDPEQPRLPASLLSRYRHYHNLERTETRLRHLLGEFSFASIRTILSSGSLPIGQDGSNGCAPAHAHTATQSSLERAPADQVAHYRVGTTPGAIPRRRSTTRDQAAVAPEAPASLEIAAPGPPTPSALPSHLRGERFTYIDALRGLGAFGVMMFHFTSHGLFESPDGNWLGFIRTLTAYGDLGVPVFFVISGFVIAHSVGRTKVTPGYFGNFALRRSIRLDPPFWLAIAFATALAWVSQHVIAGSGSEVPTVPRIVAHILYVYPLLGYEPIEPVFWTLVHEVQFYALYIVMFGLLQRFSGKTVPPPTYLFMTLAVTSLLSALTLVQVDGLCFHTWYMFALGVTVYYWHTSAIKTEHMALIVGLVLLALTFDPTRYKVAALLTVLSVAAVAGAGGLTRFLRNRTLQFLGAISYSLYVLHGVLGWPVLSVGERISGDDRVMALAWLAVAVAFSIVMATLMRWYIEVPSIQLAKKLKRLKATPQG
jgi:polysaccharide deacetylase family protein (PEP-CTERM system associated)